LQQYGRFGVHLGLERIQRLLADLGNPHAAVPILHVAGTNGKGSVCAYLSAILTQAGYRVGRYTSPHLLDWTERICINDQPITPDALRSQLLQVEAAIDPAQPSPTQFEVITAAAWLYFAQQQVDIAVIEVGLGGRLDATNVCDRPLVSVVTSLSREHWQRLGPTLADIAFEKAGILKPHCPAVIGPLPSEAQVVVEKRLNGLDCPTVWPQPAVEITPGTAQYQFTTGETIQYPLPFLGAHQLVNSALAIATLEFLQQQGWSITPEQIQQGMAQARWRGRLQWLTWQGQPILVDGAHNTAAAQALRQYIDRYLAEHQEANVTWIVGVLATKDHADMLNAWLRPRDRVYFVPVPDHQSADPNDLVAIAQAQCSLDVCQSCPDLATALHKAVTDAPTQSGLTVLCGSLYLIGHFLQTQQALAEVPSSSISP
jgi:dihydrofolate synthase/folylpolyglutamate synthase